MNPLVNVLYKPKRASTSGITSEDLFWNLKKNKLVDSFRLKYLAKKKEFGNDFWIHRETVVRDLMIELLNIHYQKTNSISKQTIQSLIDQINDAYMMGTV